MFRFTCKTFHINISETTRGRQMGVTLQNMEHVPLKFPRPMILSGPARTSPVYTCWPMHDATCPCVTLVSHPHAPRTYRLCPCAAREPRRCIGGSAGRPINGARSGVAPPGGIVAVSAGSVGKTTRGGMKKGESTTQYIQQ